MVEFESVSREELIFFSFFFSFGLMNREVWRLEGRVMAVAFQQVVVSHSKFIAVFPFPVGSLAEEKRVISTTDSMHPQGVHLINRHSLLVASWSGEVQRFSDAEGGRGFVCDWSRMAARTGGIVCLSSTAECVVLGLRDGRVVFFDLGSGAPVGECQMQHGKQVSSIAFNGSILATTSDDFSLRLWTSRGEVLQNHLVSRSKYPTCSAFMPASSPQWWLVAVGCTAGLVTLLCFAADSLPQAALVVWSQKVGTNRITAISVSPDNLSLVVGSAGNTVTLLSSESGHPIATFHGHVSPVTQVLHLSSDRWDRIASASVDGNLIVWRPSYKEERMIRSLCSALKVNDFDEAEVLSSLAAQVFEWIK